MPETRHYTFRSRPEAVSAARRALDGFEHRLDLTVFYDASLCISELVTNAVLHAEVRPDDKLELEVAISDAKLRVSVTDPGRGFEPGELRFGDESGWGLYIVDRLSDRWGVERTDRTRVWFELTLDAAVELEGSHPVAEPAAAKAPSEPRRRGSLRSRVRTPTSSR